jgi:hypothetical protein
MKPSDSFRLSVSFLTISRRSYLSFGRHLPLLLVKERKLPDNARGGMRARCSLSIDMLLVIPPPLSLLVAGP